MKSLVKSRLGETNIANNGMKMTIIIYKNARDLAIQFEDDLIVYNRSYRDFKRGIISHPNSTIDRLGETSIASNGMKMTIIAYRNVNDIDIQFEDGTVVYNKMYQHFKKGYIQHPEDKFNIPLGETNMSNIGLKMTIISYRSSRDIDVQFEDGTIVYNRRYNAFKEGSIKHPNGYNINRIGKIGIANNGMKMTIIAYRKSSDIDIQFEDEIIVCNKSYLNFKRGIIAHPNIGINGFGTLLNHTLNGVAYHLNNNEVYYYCECQKCGKKDILSPQQMLAHKCEV